MMLDVSEYWKQRGEVYLEEFSDQPYYEKERMISQEKKVIELLKKNNFKTILEIGCGFGRYTKILDDIFKPEKYCAVDISKTQIDKAKKYVNNEKITFLCNKIQDYSPSEKFDLVFAGEVLMHIKFDDIEVIIAKLVQCAMKKIITVDWYDGANIGKEHLGYCFMHDYEALFKKYGAKRVKIHRLSLSTKLKMISKYAKMRGRSGIGVQSIIEIDI